MAGDSHNVEDYLVHQELVQYVTVGDQSYNPHYASEYYIYEEWECGDDCLAWICVFLCKAKKAVLKYFINSCLRN
jgi:hypothetical protein